MPASNMVESVIANDSRGTLERSLDSADGTGYNVRKRSKIAAEGFGETGRIIVIPAPSLVTRACTRSHTHTSQRRSGFGNLAIRKNDATERKPERAGGGTF